LNAQIRRLFFVFSALFVALVGITSYWLWRAPELEARRGNPNLIVRQLTIERGLIYASNGKTLLARNVRKEQPELGRTWYLRRYPRHQLTAHAVGYSTVERSRSGLEQSLNDYLTGSNLELNTIVESTLDRLQGITQRGNHVITTLSLRGQRAAAQGLQGKCGGVVALEPATGKVLVMASSPSFDPNLVERRFNRIIRQTGPCQPAAPLLNRTAQGRFIPGSTFKIVTATAALDSGRFTPESRFNDPGYCVEYGKRVFNYADQSGPSVFGSVDFGDAVENSINSVFCEIGKRLGPQLIIEYMRRFGFYEEPPIELPSDEVTPSGLYRNGRLYSPDDPNAVDPGRLAFGQERLQVTPLQMALVAAAVANGGIVMEPTLVDRIVSRGGKVISRSRPNEWKTAMKPGTAADLAAMMRRVVESGTATSAQIPGLSMAGKTGTAETGREGQNDTWFIAFAPVEAPRVAVAVGLSNQDGTGGSTAAPIARSVIAALLRRNA
jgi:penicillin-binding protein A